MRKDMSKTIVISPFASHLKDGKKNAKDYPYWSELVKLLANYHIIQIGTEPEEKFVKDVRFGMKLIDIKDLLKDALTFIAVDNFLQHYAHYYGYKGIVIWGKSDPKLFGYPENINLFKDTKYFRKNQWDVWHNEPYEPSVFVYPDVIYSAVKDIERSQKETLEIGV